MESLAIIDYVLWSILLALAIGIIISRNLVVCLVYLAIFSLITAAIYMRLHAPDVAITEAAIGAAVSTLFFLATMQFVGKTEDSIRRYSFASASLLAVSFVFVLLAVIEMPIFADPSAPATTYLGNYYTDNTIEETGITNAVTAVLGSYRGFDTLGEVYVILAAGIGVLLILPLTMWNKKVKD